MPVRLSRQRPSNKTGSRLRNLNAARDYPRSRKLARLLLRDLLALLAGLGQADGDSLFAAGNLLAASPTLERSAPLLVHRALHFLGSRPRIFAWHKLISCCGRRGNVSSNRRFLNSCQREAKKR